MPKIKQYLPNHIKVIAQGEIVAASLMNYLQRHPEMDANCSKNGKLEFYTTDAVETFNEHAAIFLERKCNQNIYICKLN